MDPTPTRLDELYEERRKYPRIVIDVPLALKKSKGNNINAVAHDISIDGLQIRCSRDAAKALHPSGKFIQENKGPRVEVNFQLPLEKKPESVSMICQVYYLAVLPDNDIAFGLLFKKFKNNSAKLVDRFIMEYIVPVEDKVRSFLDKPRSHHEIKQHMQMQVNEVDEVLNRIRIKGDIVSYGDISDARHLKLSSALIKIFDKLDKLAERIVKLEKSINKN